LHAEGVDHAHEHGHEELGEVYVIGVVEPGEGPRDRKVLVAPPANTVFREGEILLLLGKIANLNRFSALMRD